MNGMSVFELENKLHQSRKTAAVGAALERLRRNADFKLVIMQGFFEQEAIRLVHLKGQADQQTPEAQKSILARMDAIGGLQAYLEAVTARAEEACKAVEFDEQTRDELLAEGRA